MMAAFSVDAAITAELARAIQKVVIMAKGNTLTIPPSTDTKR
jgi:hypothetical protein